MSVWSIWVVVSLVLGIIELVTTTVYFFCFAIAAMLTAIVAACDLDINVQLAVFAVLCILVSWFGKPIVDKKLYSNKDELKTNVDALTGMSGKVIELIKENEPGRVLVHGDDWRALSLDGKVIEVGTSVVVIRVESNKLYVQRK